MVVWKPEGKMPSERDVKRGASLSAAQKKRYLRKRENVMLAVVSPADGEASSLYPSMGWPSLEGMDALLKESKDVLPKPCPQVYHPTEELRIVLNWFEVQFHQPIGLTRCHRLNWTSYARSSMSCSSLGPSSVASLHMEHLFHSSVRKIEPYACVWTTEH